MGGTVELWAPEPVEEIADLVVDVAEINLDQGIANSLAARLDSAIDALLDANQNNDGAAVGKLQAFINAVEAQRGKRITNPQADYLIGRAQAIISRLAP